MKRVYIYVTFFLNDCVREECLYVFGVHCSSNTNIGDGIKFNPFFTGMALYYLVMLIPNIHQIYNYNLEERTIPKWTYLYLIFYSQNQPLRL